ncbi:MAG: molybdenum cofactor biosynthesis protein MoaE [Methylococcales bacterium]|nr:molybdenum cofactor biosynthesis protein MoaE [Methylococcales bacterium]
MKIKIIEQGFNPLDEVQNYQQTLTDLTGKFGATHIFIGTMRDFNDGDDVKRMRLEHYPGMTEKYLTKTVEQAMQQWAILDVLLIHRVGELQPNEPIVLIAVWAHHRGDAFDSCRYIMEDLKSKAPFWKQEQLEQGSRWVSNNTNGYQS